MKVSKAIEVLKDLDTTLPQSDPEERREAVKLGIEALKYFQRGREGEVIIIRALLPGETPEEEVEVDKT